MDHATELPQRLGDLLASLNRENLEAVLPNLLALYDEAMVFRDPIQELRGKPAFEHMNRSLAARSRAFHFELLDRAGDDARAFLRWRMVMQPKLGRTMEVEGTSFLRANDAGLVVEHVDYWDLPSFFASAVPGGERMLRALLKPIA